MRDGFEEFYKNPKIPALSIILPKDLLKECESLERLKFLVLPYQCEVLATEIDLRLYPFLYHQMRNTTDEEQRFFYKNHRERFIIGSKFTEAMVEDCVAQNVLELSEYLHYILSSVFMQGHQSLMLGDLMHIGAGGILLPHELENPDDPIKNKNMFGIVTCPFYPKEFGRYSKDIRIFITRHADFASMNKNARREIRHHSNSILENAGIDIKDLFEDKQPDGLWLPEFKNETITEFNES